MKINSRLLRKDLLMFRRSLEAEEDKIISIKAVIEAAGMNERWFYQALKKETMHPERLKELAGAMNQDFKKYIL
jgi:hypothetical protein